MAAVNCAVCDAELGPADLMCPGCGTPAQAARRARNPIRSAETDPGPVPETHAVAVPADGAAARRAEDPPGQRSTCVDPTCGAPLPEGADTCPYCRTPVARLALDFPWGSVPVPVEGEVPIGREPSWSSLAGRLAGHHDVSRRHAVVSRRGAALWVRDVGSTYGTFRNGTRLATDEETDLAEGDQLKFGVSLTAQVRNVR